MIDDIKGRLKINVHNIDKNQPRRTDIAARIILRQQVRQREDVGDGRHALLLAESADHPDRTALIKIFKDVDVYGHITRIVSS